MVLGTSVVQMGTVENTMGHTESSWPGEEGERGPAGHWAGWEIMLSATAYSLLPSAQS